MAAPDGARRLRVAELIRRELAGALQDFARASGAGLLSLTQVDVAPDLRSARVGVSVVGGRLGNEELLRRLAELAELIGDLEKLAPKPSEWSALKAERENSPEEYQKRLSYVLPMIENLVKWYK